MTESFDLRDLSPSEAAGLNNYKRFRANITAIGPAETALIHFAMIAATYTVRGESRKFISIFPRLLFVGNDSGSGNSDSRVISHPAPRRPGVWDGFRRDQTVKNEVIESPGIIAIIFKITVYPDRIP